MRPLALVAALLLPSITSAQAPVVPTFAGIPWGTSGDDVLKAAATAGLTVVTRDEDGDYELSGTLFGAPAVVYAFISPTSGLVKVQVRIATTGDKPTTKFAEVVDSLSAQYGRTEQVELFKTPYRRGDGLEDEAVRAGKGLLLSAWGDDREPGQALLVVRVTKTVVGLDYESHGWSAELERRKARAAVPSDPRLACAQAVRSRAWPA